MGRFNISMPHLSTALAHPGRLALFSQPNGVSGKELGNYFLLVHLSGPDVQKANWNSQEFGFKGQGKRTNNTAVIYTIADDRITLMAMEKGGQFLIKL